jgi:hypothetical protein
LHPDATTVTDPRRVAAWLLEQEARSLLTRLQRVRPFALQETMLPAAAVAPQAQVAIERFLIGGRTRLRAQVHDFLRWLRGPGRRASAEEVQRRFTLIRLAFNNVITHFDLFSDVITQRSESETGIFLSGLDVFAADAVELPGYYESLPVVCYLDRGPGAAIRRARTRLPGGGMSPVSVVRVPRERMVGQGIASSLVHECGHAAAALLDLRTSLQGVLRGAEAAAPAHQRIAWRLWQRWISEIVADLWSVGKLGIGSTLGLIGVVSLPAYFVFRINTDDPHPVPWIRVKVSCALGKAFYPHPQWDELARVWASLYPPTGLSPDQRALLAVLEETIPVLADLLASHRPPALRGHSLGEVLPLAERRPARLLAHYRAWRRDRRGMRAAKPSLVFAVLGQARASNLISPEHESRLVAELLTLWALRSTLDLTEICATVPRAPLRRPGVLAVSETRVAVNA